MNKSLKAMMKYKANVFKNRNTQGMFYFPTIYCFKVRCFQSVWKQIFRSIQSM